MVLVVNQVGHWPGALYWPGLTAPPLTITPSEWLFKEWAGAAAAFKWEQSLAPFCGSFLLS